MLKSIFILFIAEAWELIKGKLEDFSFGYLSFLNWNIRFSWLVDKFKFKLIDTIFNLCW